MTTTARKLLNGSVSRIILLITSIGIGLFMMPFLVHNLGDEQYGMWVLVGAVVSFYSLMDFGMARAMQRFLIRSIHGNDPNESNIALSTSIALSTAVGLITFLITIGIIIFSRYFISADENILLFNITIALVGFKASIQLPLFSYYGILVAHYRYDVISIIQFFAMLIRTALVILFINNGHGIISIASIAILTDVGGSLFVIHYAKKLLPDIKATISYFRSDRLKEYFHFGKWNYIIQITHKIRFSIDEFVVGTIIGLGAVTHYTIASSLINYFSSFMESAFGVFQPIFHKYHKLDQWDNLRELFLITTEISGFASILIGCLLFSLGEPFINVWMGKGYTDSFMVLLILCTANIFYKSISPCEKILFAIDRQKFYAKTSTVEAITNLTLSLILSHYIGIYGVALGTLMPSLISNLILLPMYTCRQLKLPYQNFYSILFKAITLGAITFIPMHYLTNLYTPDNLLILALYGALFSAIYILLCLRFFISNNATALILDSVPARLAIYIKPLTRQYSLGDR